MVIAALTVFLLLLVIVVGAALLELHARRTDREARELFSTGGAE